MIFPFHIHLAKAKANCFLTLRQVYDARLDYREEIEVVGVLFRYENELHELGYTPKATLPRAQVLETFAELMNSWAVTHEVKLLTCAVALSEWFDKADDI